MEKKLCNGTFVSSDMLCSLKIFAGSLNTGWT